MTWSHKLLIRALRWLDAIADFNLIIIKCPVHWVHKRGVTRHIPSHRKTLSWLSRSEMSRLLYMPNIQRALGQNLLWSLSLPFFLPPQPRTTPLSLPLSLSLSLSSDPIYSMVLSFFQNTSTSSTFTQKWQCCLMPYHHQLSPLVLCLLYFKAAGRW